MQYTLRNPIERHFAFSVWFRTVRPAGNLLFPAGRVDYSILELREGEVRYRWDLGSGEGVVAVQGRLDDCGWHHVKLERFGNSAELLVTRLVSNNLDLYSKFINLNFDQSKNFTSLLGLDWCNKNNKLTFKGLKLDIDEKTVYAKR